jgi:hypothetical protein
MKTRTFTDEEQLILKAVDVLIKELGPVEAGRFLALPEKKRIESVKHHHRWQVNCGENNSSTAYSVPRKMTTTGRNG